MASRHDPQLGPSAGSAPELPLDKAASDAAQSDLRSRARGHASTELSDDLDSLETLRRVWLASDDGSDADAIVAATEPMGPAQQEQIVQRFLRSSLDERARERSEPPAVATLPQRLPPLLRRTPLWSVAAACALCCWLAVRAPLEGDASGPEQTAAHPPANGGAGPQRRARSTSTSGDPRATAIAPKSTASPGRREALTDLAETYAQQQRFEEAEVLLQRALTEQELRPSAHKEVADTLTRLAALYQVQHLYAKAEPLYMRAFEIDPPFAVF